jgi:malonate transporter
VALFTIGAVLWRAGQHASRRTPLRRLPAGGAIKLLVHPLLVLALAAGGAPALGVPFPASRSWC